MKKFIYKVVAFLIGLVVLDAFVGVVARCLVSNAKGGDTGLSNYICRQMKEKCVIFGSSRGMHHYDPQIISDSLSMSCWNCSLDGNGIILMYGRYMMISRRYTPSVLIYDIHTSFDLLDGDDSKYLGALRYYYDDPGIDSIFWSVDKTERYKMLSNCYRYNSQWLQLISDNIHPLQGSDKGYKPVDKKMLYTPKAVMAEKVTYKYDALKLKYLEKLVLACKEKGTKLLFTISPQYDTHDDRVYAPLKKICKKYDVPLLNHYCDKDFVDNADYFYDSVHMNRTGASAYTKKIVGEVRKFMNEV